MTGTTGPAAPAAHELEMYRRRVGARLTGYRTHAGLTVQELAVAARVPHAVVASLEAGGIWGSRYGQEAALKLARALGVSLHNDLLAPPGEETDDVVCAHLVWENDADDEADDVNPQIAAAERLLPAWLTERMMMDCWSFGLLLVTGQVLAITTINRVTQDASGALWLDVEMSDNPGVVHVPAAGGRQLPVIYAPTSRTEASVNVAHIVTAFELADT